MLIDTHAHLRWDSYEHSLEDVLERAKEAGVNTIIGVSSSVNEARGVIEIAKKFKGVYAGVGIHPQDTNPNLTDSIDDQLKELSKVAENERVVAIGECGFDFSQAPGEERQRSVLEQEEIFGFQLELSQKLNKPIVIHSRNAKEKTIEFINKFSPRGVWHCFVEDWETAQIALNSGLYLSFNGIITYKSGIHILEIAKKTPLDRILLETDSPFLLPEPQRSDSKVKINEPCYVKIVAEAIAKIKGVSFEEVSIITSSNAQKLFGLKT